MLTFRPITWADASPLYVWRHDPETVKWSFKEPPTWDEHLRWMNIMTSEERPDIKSWIGIRFLNPNVPLVCVETCGREVNIMTNPCLRKTGFATQALKYIQTFNLPLRAIIKIGNEASIALFQKCGFRHIANLGYKMIWEWMP